MERFKIYVFRHWQTNFNRDNKFTGWKDAKLTSAGRDDARIVALRLKGKKFQVAFHTSLSRSKDTLKEVLKSHPECVCLKEDDRMLERNYGNLNGKSHLWACEKFGVEMYDKWHRGFKDRPPKGESFSDVEKRVSEFIDDLKEFIKENKVSVAISAHGNSIRLFRKIIEKASEKEACGWFIPYDSVFEYDVYG